eukprot:GHRR01028427.1.p1 GENE.GHRR01028427.1~~GHRR01028427.1.p1  ORF type:complete len:173 (+),score=43.92 GHRR01028427.1:351-869(+)
MPQMVTDRDRKVLHTVSRLANAICKPINCSIPAPACILVIAILLTGSSKAAFAQPKWFTRNLAETTKAMTLMYIAHPGAYLLSWCILAVPAANACHQDELLHTLGSSCFNNVDVACAVSSRVLHATTNGADHGINILNACSASKDNMKNVRALCSAVRLQWRSADASYHLCC